MGIDMCKQIGGIDETRPVPIDMYIDMYVDMYIDTRVATSCVGVERCANGEYEMESCVECRPLVHSCE